MSAWRYRKKSSKRPREQAPGEQTLLQKKSRGGKTNKSPRPSVDDAFLFAWGRVDSLKPRLSPQLLRHGERMDVKHHQIREKRRVAEVAFVCQRAVFESAGVFFFLLLPRERRRRRRGPPDIRVSSSALVSLCFALSLARPQRQTSRTTSPLFAHIPLRAASTRPSSLAKKWGHSCCRTMMPP